MEIILPVPRYRWYPGFPERDGNYPLWPSPDGPWVRYEDVIKYLEGKEK